MVLFSKNYFYEVPALTSTKTAKMTTNPVSIEASSKKFPETSMIKLFKTFCSKKFNFNFFVIILCQCLLNEYCGLVKFDFF